jgi:hypothetical protein
VAEAGWGGEWLQMGLMMDQEVPRARAGPGQLSSLVMMLVASFRISAYYLCRGWSIGAAVASELCDEVVVDVRGRPMLTRAFIVIYLISSQGDNTGVSTL